MRILTWALQVLILTAGIHLFLRFVRTTRGNRMIRGLLVTVLGGVVGLWGLSELLELEELRHLLQISTGFIVVTLAIVFQPELRRAIAQLGERSILGRLMKSSGQDTVARVLRAAQAMASRRIGALIAFERETSLHNYIEEGTVIDSNANARLIESIFHPGTPLHDGAIIIRRDRVAAAGCIFPLPQEAEIDASMGTRHRAAMGLTEDTDAVVLVVSEETGRISVAREGRLATSIAPDQLEEELRSIISGREGGEDPLRRRVIPISLAAWKRDVVWLLGSALVACGVLYVAHQDILDTEEFNVRISAVSPTVRRQPMDGELLVLLPRESQVQISPARDQWFVVVGEGSRAQIDEIGTSLRGVLDIGSGDWAGGIVDLDLVRWENRVKGVSFRWRGDPAPDLKIEEYEETTRTISLDDVMVDARGLNGRYEFPRAQMSFRPSAEVTVRGPKSQLDRLGNGLRLEFAPIVLTEETRTDFAVRLRLAASLLEERFSLVTDPPVEVVVPIFLASRDVDTLSKDIALICGDPSRTAELARWQLPATGQVARFTIWTRGLIPADAGTPGLQNLFTVIRRFVDENLMVFVDVSELPPAGEGRTVPVRWAWRKEWRENLDALGLDGIGITDRHRLEVRLDSEEEILLEVRAPAPPETGEKEDQEEIP